MTQVIIVGAGPAGSVLASLLAQRSIESLLLDRATFPREKICGDYLSPGTLRLLDQLNLLGEVQVAGARRLWGMTVTAPDGTTFRAEYPATSQENGAHPFALSIPRAKLDTLLLEQARRWGVKCLEAFRVTDLIWTGGRVRGVTGIGPHGRESYRGQVVVGADGRGSVVARRLGLHRPHPTLHRMALVAYYEGASELRDHGAISVGDGSYCILNPVGDGLINTSIVMDQTKLLPWKGHLEELFDVTLAAFPRTANDLRAARRTGPIRCLGPLAFRASQTSMAGALLIGDAAGFYDPFTGEGVYHALWSANLAAREIAGALTNGGMTPPRLNRFDRGQRKALAVKHRLCAALQAVISRPAAANALARLLRRRQPLADLLLGVIGDLLPPRALLSIRALKPPSAIIRGASWNNT